MNENLNYVFQSDLVSYDELLTIYWRTIDPTDADGQNTDRGSQYRTAIFVHDDEQRELLDAFRHADEVELPSGFDYRIGGQRQEMETSFDSMRLAISLAIFMVYLVMASQFESLIHPLVILFSVPFALIGLLGTVWGIMRAFHSMALTGSAPRSRSATTASTARWGPFRFSTPGSWTTPSTACT